VGFGFISLGHVNRFFLSFFLFKAGASALKLFFAGDGYADSHISTAYPLPALHTEEKIFAF